MPLNAQQFLSVISGKFAVPEGGWNSRLFALHGIWLLRTMVRAAQITQRRAIPVVARNAMKVFRKQLEQIISKVTGKLAEAPGHKDPAATLMFPQHETLWAHAIDQVLRETGLDAILEIVPPVQSTMAQGYSKTGILLGQETNPEVNQRIAREARAVAQRITGIGQTTRNQMETVVRNSVAEGLTVAETAQVMRDTMPQKFANRALTIARTELNNSWTQGAAIQYQNSNVVTHVSVIGCQAREPSSPQFRGESTCNIQDVPVQDVDELMGIGWHINHTGTLVPSQFREEDGSTDPDAPRPTIFDEQSQAES